MRSTTTEQFRKLFSRLPVAVQDRAREAYVQWREDPNHPGLHFKRIHPSEPVYSVRIGMHYRAVALVENGAATWFWIGSHSDYDKLRSAM